MGKNGRKKKWSKEIRETRELLGLSQRAFAELLGVYQSTVNFWETGQVVPGDRKRAFYLNLCLSASSTGERG